MINPATIVDLESRVDLSVDAIFRKNTLTPQGPGFAPLGGTPLANNAAGEMKDDKPFFNPTAGFITPLKRGVMGMAISGSGLVNRFPNSRTTIASSTGENFDRRVEYKATKVAMSYAFKFFDGWSIGAAINGGFATLRADSLTNKLQRTKSNYLYDSAFGVGFEFGVYKAFQNLRLGIGYNSRQYFEEFDRYNDLITGSLDIPQTLQAGIAYFIFPYLELVADYKFIHWSDVPQYGNAPETGGVEWQDQHILKLGMNFNYMDALTFRVGGSFGNSPVTENRVFVNGLFSALSEDHLTLGFSFDLTSHYIFHFAYERAFKNSLKENGEGGSFSEAGLGTITSIEANSFNVGISYNF